MADILITGGTGQVGTSLQGLRWASGINIFAPLRSELDLSDVASVEAIMRSRQWSAVLNCGAYTAVDKAETDSVAAWQINALAPVVLARETARLGVPLIHVSTDYVFDGSKADSYEVNDSVAPLGVYGASKEAGEQAVRTGNARHVIVRTAWVVSQYGNNFVKTMLRLGADRPLLRVVGDQFGCPTHAGDLAAALQVIALKHLGDVHAPTGTYHFTNAGSVSWCGLAQEIFDVVAKTGANVPKVIAITTAEYPTPARRPANSRLVTDKIGQDFGIVPRDWQEAIADIVAVLKQN
jgi:dTDP-4-dehydrorhamnose reductase